MTAYALAHPYLTFLLVGFLLLIVSSFTVSYSTTPVNVLTPEAFAALRADVTEIKKLLQGGNDNGTT